MIKARKSFLRYRDLFKGDRTMEVRNLLNEQELALIECRNNEKSVGCA